MNFSHENPNGRFIYFFVILQREVFPVYMFT